MLGYAILDLDATNQTYFSLQANSFDCLTLLIDRVKYSTCHDTWLLGGFNILAGSSTMDEFFSKTYYGLSSHNMIYFSFTLYKIDSWDNGDFVKIEFDLVSLIGGWPGSYDPDNKVPNKQNFCGDRWSDLIDSKVFGRVPHDAPSLTLKFTSGLNEDSVNESTGYRDLKLLFANTTDTVATTQSICIVTTAYYSVGICGCEEGFYQSESNCSQCDSLCKSCFGSTSRDCYNCADGAGWNGTACVACNPTCASCFGAGAAQCTTCLEGYVMSNSGSCILESNCKSPMMIDTSDPMNYTYCRQPAEDVTNTTNSSDSADRAGVSVPFTLSIMLNVIFIIIVLVCCYKRVKFRSRQGSMSDKIVDRPYMITTGQFYGEKY